jgi:hypothetical protein
MPSPLHSEPFKTSVKQPVFRAGALAGIKYLEWHINDLLKDVTKNENLMDNADVNKFVNFIKDNMLPKISNHCETALNFLGDET